MPFSCTSHIYFSYELISFTSFQSNSPSVGSFVQAIFVLDVVSFVSIADHIRQITEACYNNVRSHSTDYWGMLQQCQITFDRLLRHATTMSDHIRQTTEACYNNVRSHSTDYWGMLQQWQITFDRLLRHATTMSDHIRQTTEACYNNDRSHSTDYWGMLQQCYNNVRSISGLNILFQPSIKQYITLNLTAMLLTVVSNKMIGIYFCVHILSLYLHWLEYKKK